ncbi:MAG: isoprenyl transferase [Deltaproteobacteria bacterium]|nr:isoprenyl transferase [Deltaproteobacteria bacterium]
MSTVIDKDRLPRHVAVIMDGNGRWAQRRGLSRIEGHKRGKDAVQAVVETSRELGLEYLTLYAFSTENWQRPSGEVRALMGLLRRYLRTELQRMMKNNIRLRAAGDLDRLPLAVHKALDDVVFATRNNDGLTVVLAVSYGAREEIVAATRALTVAVQEGRLDPQQIDEQCFGQYLWTAGIPDPDLLIRTSGEFRLSNFLLWQLAYTEIYVTDTLWPDFGREEFLRALADYQGRERRFGRTAEQPLPSELRRAAR